MDSTYLYLGGFILIAVIAGLVLSFRSLKIKSI